MALGLLEKSIARSSEGELVVPDDIPMASATNVTHDVSSSPGSSMVTTLARGECAFLP